MIPKKKSGLMILMGMGKPKREAVKEPEEPDDLESPSEPEEPEEDEPAEESQESGGISPEEVGWHSGEERCENCVHFDGNDTCQKFNFPTDPGGYSRGFAVKESKDEGSPEMEEEPGEMEAVV